jgi:hypothetical protein
MNVLEYNDSNYREKQEQKEKDDFAIGFAEWLLNERTGFNRETEIKELLEMYKKEKGL